MSKQVPMKPKKYKLMENIASMTVKTFCSQSQ